jgi:hypothetical protein
MLSKTNTDKTNVSCPFLERESAATDLALFSTPQTFLTKSLAHFHLPLAVSLASSFQSPPMRFPHHQHWKSSHPNTSKMPPLSLWSLTKGERSWGKSTSETRRLERDLKRGPEGVGANVRTKLPPRTAQKTSLLRQPNRIHYPAAAAARVGQGMLTLALDPLLDVGELRVVWEEWRQPTS